MKQCARNHGPETEAIYTSFTQWCEDNAPAFSSAAFAALELSLDRQNACKSKSLLSGKSLESLNTSSKTNTYFLLLFKQTPGTIRQTS